MRESANQLSLLELPTRSKRSLTDRVAAHFRALPNVWIDAHDLMRVGGFAGWRTRVSELRHAPYQMHIVNRTRRVNGYTVSEYQFVKDNGE